MRRETLTLVIAAALHLVGLLLFNEGFFLTRVELPNKSSCAEVPIATTNLADKNDKPGSDHDKLKKETNQSSNIAQFECWTRPRFKRAIVLVIDALRYDFAAWDSTSTSQKPFENKMAAIRDLLLQRPSHSMLVPFYADPPTTTMQRLKGVVTGGLPTFMEIKDDVASEGIEITEDNFIDLLINDGNRNITFMGDDTWTVLFPSQFNRAYPYPSFNVKDLHTVDEGVLLHLLPEMRRDDWSFLVGHFLGVDHCGHRFGPDNEHMTKKLLQMNQAIDDVVHEMDKGGYEDTVLLVFGDHGMTEDGNHGGATEEEVGAALFIYSPSPILLGGKDSDEDVDGALKKNLLQELKLLHEDDEENIRNTKEKVPWQLTRRSSVQQIDLAPTLGLLLGLPIPFGNLGSIVPELFFIGDNWLDRYRALNEALEVNVGQVLRYLGTYRERAGKQQGITEGLLNQFREETRNAFRHLKVAEAEGLPEEELLTIHRETYRIAHGVLKQASAEGRSLWTQFNLTYMLTGFGLLLLGLVVSIVGLYANHGDSLRSMPTSGTFVFMLTVVIQMLSRLSNSYIVAEAKVITFLTATNIVYVFWCVLRQTPLPPVVKDHQEEDVKLKSPQRFGTVFVSSCAVLICARLGIDLGEVQWWRGQEAVLGDTQIPFFWIVSLLPGLVIMFISAIWIAPWLGLKRQDTTHLLVQLQGIGCLAHWIFQSTGVLPLGRLWLPRLVFMCGLPGFITVVCGAQDDVPRGIFQLMFPYLLVVGPVSTSVCVLFLVHVAALCKIHTQLDFGDLSIASLWSLASMTYFFATGHESSFNKLHYASPFVGFDEYEYFRGGFMMGTNTFGMYMILIGLVSCLTKSRQTRACILMTLVTVQACRSIVMTGFVAAERRHLMVWAIFAPKYVFDGVTLLIVDAFVVLYSFKSAKSEVVKEH